jgi:aspartyl/asparaginyl-tRNA synthetase
MFNYIFQRLETRFKSELQIISQQYPFTPFEYLETPLRLQYKDGIAMLQQHGIAIGELEDLRFLLEYDGLPNK